MLHEEKIIILDFGSQYTQLIARKIREIGVYAEIFPYNISEEMMRSLAPKGIILSGGPASVYEKAAPLPSFDVLEFDVPILGICYGLQYIAFKKSGEVDKAARREFGSAQLIIDFREDIFDGVADSVVWMSHGDSLKLAPQGFQVIAHSSNSPICAIKSIDKPIYGVQFHPEVHHSIQGKSILENFVRKICGISSIWNSQSFIEASIKDIKSRVGNDEVILALSGGVDSTVAAVLLHNAIGNKLHCVHIDTGLMRSGESHSILKLFKESFNISVELIDGSHEFISRLHGIIDPEQKRKIIGATFIELFERSAANFKNAQWLAQGTLYPDVIESHSVNGPSATIKSHHNVGGLPEKMNLKILEPFRELFKDEVRQVGFNLGVPEWFVSRHPFPGPGLAIRILGSVTNEKIRILQKADDIFLEEIRLAGLYDDIWQAFAVLLPVQSVGVMGDERTYENTCVLRAVSSVDGMTADWFPIPYEILANISNRIINEVRGINRVAYDISSKPPATIEWE